MNFLRNTSALLAIFLTSLVLFAVGCGDSRDDFVATNNVNQANTGSLTFRFQRANAQADNNRIVPFTTTNLRFDLFSTNTATDEGLVLTETRPFAEVVTLDGVPVSVIFVAVSAINGENLPSTTLTGAVSVNVGENNEVDLSTATPVTFDSVTASPDPLLVQEGQTGQVILNGVLSGDTFQLPINEQFASFSCDDPSVANISSTGEVSFNPPMWGGENCTATVEYTLFGVTLNDTFLIRTFDLIAQTNTSLAPTGDPSRDLGYFIEFVDSNRQRFNVTADSTFALETELNGVSVNPNTGIISVDPDPSLEGTDFNIIVSWVDDRDAANNGTGLTFRTTVRVSIVSAGG